MDDYGTPHVRSWLRRSFQQEQNGGEFRFFPWVILLGLLVGGASYWSSNKEVLGLFRDDGIYAVVAKSLSDGAGYRIISLPTTPDQTKYPFLYSYILSWLWSLDPKFPDNIGLLKAANAGFLTAIFILSYLFYRHRVKGEESEGLLFAALVCINPAVFSFTDFTVSDILFLLTFSLCFVIFDSSEAVHFAARQGYTIVSYCCSCLSDSISSGTVSSGGSRSFRMEQALSRLDALCMPCGSVYHPLVAVGSNPFKSNSELAASSIMFRTVRNRPRLQSSGPIRSGP